MTARLLISGTVNNVAVTFAGSTVCSPGETSEPNAVKDRDAADRGIFVHIFFVASKQFVLISPHE